MSEITPVKAPRLSDAVPFTERSVVAAPPKTDAKAFAMAPESSPRVDPQEMRRKLTEAVQELNQQAEKTGRTLGFTIDRVAGRDVVTVRDQQSGDVVRQIPSEAVLRVAHSIESLKGVIYSESA